MSKYTLLISVPMNGSPSFFAATHSLPEPANGTKTYPFSGPWLHDFNSFSHNASGFCVG